jgi:Uncharacterized protein conserved in bacteria
MRLFARRPIFRVVATAFVIGLFLMACMHGVSANDGIDRSNHLVAIYDRDMKKVIQTNASTVAEVLDVVQIELGEGDRVEPGLDEVITSRDFSVNIYRARPVLVVDGMSRVKILTATQTSEEIVAEAGVNLLDEDIVELRYTDDVIETGTNIELVVLRSKTIELNFYGKKTKVRTQSTTIDEFLREKEISDEDFVSLPRKTIIRDGLKVDIWRNGKNMVVKEETIKFGVEQTKDYDRDVGYRKVTAAGENGRKTVTYEIVMRNGKEVSRKVTSEVVTKKPKTQKEIVGVKTRMIPYTGGGKKDDWLRAAGVPEKYWGYADFLVSRESGWNPNAVNASSGACGLAQALPCSKVPGNPYNPIDSLKWMDGYVNARYGGWEGAYNFWQANHWY